MEIIDQFRWLVGGYYGIREMDEYELKVYILKEIENYIKDFLEENYIENFDYKKEAIILEKDLSLLEKLQDSLLVLQRIKAPTELVLMIKQRIKEIEKFDN